MKYISENLISMYLCLPRGKQEQHATLGLIWLMQVLVREFYSKHFCIWIGCIQSWIYSKADIYQGTSLSRFKDFFSPTNIWYYILILLYTSSFSLTVISKLYLVSGVKSPYIMGCWKCGFKEFRRNYLKEFWVKLPSFFSIQNPLKADSLLLES